MMRSLRCTLLSLVIGFAPVIAAQPVDAPVIPLSELKPGQRGEVWTVFRGTTPEPFSVEITGVLQNALGPGKSLILCQLTDSRVQHMGAVAGMSGSPLYIDGKLAGALSYQLQKFETVRYAGFTPAADLIEVKERPTRLNHVTGQPSDGLGENAVASNGADSTYRPLLPVFTVGGLSPVVSELFAPRFAAIGLTTIALGGSTQGGVQGAADPAGAKLQTAESSSMTPALIPGGAVSVALATGDITLAGTGTVSRVDGDTITAFGHPMLSLGDVELPMCTAEVLAILPSNMQSMKLSNTGRVIGTITQDRLSAISGTLGEGPRMVDVDITVEAGAGSRRTLRFSVVRHQQLTPTLIATGVSQAILGSNDAGLTNGFRLSSNVEYPGSQNLAFETLYPGPQGFTQGLGDFVQSLSANLQNPYAKTFPDRVSFSITPLDENPLVTLDIVQLSRTSVRGGETVEATLAWRDWQGDAHRETLQIPVDASWAGKHLEVIVAPGRTLDELTGRPRQIPASELRSFDAYLSAMRDDRPTHGLCLAVVERTALFSDQTVATPEAPGSIERIARGADEARFKKREAMVVLWETHALDGKLLRALVRRPLHVVD